MANQDINSLDIPELDTDFVFNRRPVAIPGDLRPFWRIGLIALLLNSCCIKKRTGFTRLHVLNWGFRSKQGRGDLKAAIDGTLLPESLVVRFDPFLNRSVDLAIGEGYIRRVGGAKIEITTKGQNLADEIMATDSAYVEEKHFIESIGRKVSDAMVKRMFKGGGN